MKNRGYRKDDIKLTYSEYGNAGNFFPLNLHSIGWRYSEWNQMHFPYYSYYFCKACFPYYSYYFYKAR